MKKYFFFILILLIIQSVNAVKIDVQPRNIFFDNVLKGGYAEKELTVTSNTDTNVDMNFLAMGEIKEWVTIDSKDLVLSKNYSSKIKVVLRPPEKTDNGIYTGNIILTFFNKQSEIFTDEATLNLKVTANIVEGIIDKIELKSVEAYGVEKGDDIDFLVTIQNIGNINQNPEIIIKISGNEHKESVELKPFEEKEVLASVNSKNLKIGGYVAEVSLFSGGKLINNVDKKIEIFDKGVENKMALISIRANRDTEEGNDIKLESFFKNEGDELVYAKFKGKVFYNNELYKEVESEEKYVPVGNVVKIDSYVPYENDGTYKVIGEVEYTNKKSEAKKSNSLSFYFETSPLGRMFKTSPIVLAVLVVVFVSITRFRLRKKMFWDD